MWDFRLVSTVGCSLNKCASPLAPHGSQNSLCHSCFSLLVVCDRCVTRRRLRQRPARSCRTAEGARAHRICFGAGHAVDEVRTVANLSSGLVDSIRQEHSAPQNASQAVARPTSSVCAASVRTGALGILGGETSHCTRPTAQYPACKSRRCTRS
jgi:hypothetical protein